MFVHVIKLDTYRLSSAVLCKSMVLFSTTRTELPVTVTVMEMKVDEFLVVTIVLNCCCNTMKSSCIADYFPFFFFQHVVRLV